MRWVWEDGSPFNPTKRDYGFIYRIDYTDGTSYIGKKNLWTFTELPPKTKGKSREDVIDTVNRVYKGKRVTMDIVQKPSDWKKYQGSSQLVGERVIQRKVVLATSPSKRNLTYLEVKALMCLNAIEDDEYLNENILGKFYRDNLI